MMMMLMANPTHGFWNAFVLIPLVIAGLTGSIRMIVSGLRGILVRRG